MHNNIIKYYYYHSYYHNYYNHYYYPLCTNQLHGNVQFLVSRNVQDQIELGQFDKEKIKLAPSKRSMESATDS